MWHLLSMLFLGFQMESENCVWRFLLLFSAYCFCCEWIFCFFFKKSFAKLEFNLFIVDQGSCWVEWNCNFIDHECVCAFVNLSIFFCCCVGSLSLSVFSYSSIRNACLQLSTGQTVQVYSPIQLDKQWTVWFYYLPYFGLSLSLAFTFLFILSITHTHKHCVHPCSCAILAVDGDGRDVTGILNLIC